MCMNGDVSIKFGNKQEKVSGPQDACKIGLSLLLKVNVVLPHNACYYQSKKGNGIQ